jgi:hypothetical protein
MTAVLTLQLDWVVMGGMPVPEAHEAARIVNHLLSKNSVLGDCRSGFF